MVAVERRTESLLLVLETFLFQKIMVSKENIDQINKTGHVLHICISIYIL